MTPSNSSSMLAAISQGNTTGNLTHRVKDLPTPQFINLLEKITSEFEYFLRAIDLINNDALENMLEQILEAFTLKIGQIIQAERTTIFMVDREKKQLWSKIAENSTEIRIPMDKGIAGHVATTGECLNIPDAYSHPLFNKEVDKKTGYRTRNILCLPIFTSKNEVVAVVQLLNKIGGQPFNPDDEHHFREFASSIGVILESCNEFYIAARNQKGVEALLKATSCLGQTLNLEKTLGSVMDEARDLMNADRSTLFLLDREKGQLWSKVAIGDGNTKIEIRIPADKGIAGFVASTGETLNIPNAYEDPRFDPSTDKKTGYTTRNILCMPVYNSSGTLIGVTQLINKHHGSFTHSDEEFMRAFNIQAGVALENAQLFESVLVEKQYQKDMLQSLSDAVISTDMQGRIVTINDAALELLGCPLQEDTSKALRELWEAHLLNRPVWEVVPVEKIQFRLEDSLQNGTKQYVPEQALRTGVFRIPVSNTGQASQPDANGQLPDAKSSSGSSSENGSIPSDSQASDQQSSGESASSSASDDMIWYGLAIPAADDPHIYLPWNHSPDSAGAIANSANSKKSANSAKSSSAASTVAPPATMTTDTVTTNTVDVGTVNAGTVDVTAGNADSSDPVATNTTAATPRQPVPKPSTVATESLPSLDWPATLTDKQVQQIERSINLTVNPLTNPEGGVRGGLVVLEDISQEKRMKTTLYRYMTPGVAERVMALGEDALMEGERKDVTILFSDIRGYTTLTENLQAVEVVRLLNDYFETMVEAVFNCEGTLDKFIGDALMAVFGAPLPLKNHAFSAVQSALDMRERLRIFNRDRISQAEAQIRIGIGISSGEVVSGNIGSQRKMEYTVIGDGVNLSSRLESITKQYGCDIVISEHTYELCGSEIWVRELDRIRVKGKNEPVGIYDVLNLKEHPLDDNTQEFLDLYERARDAYTNQRFEQAIKLFESALKIRSYDEASRLFIKRSHDYLKNPPPQDWDGVYTMMTK